MQKKKYIKYPVEYIAAQIEFGLAVSRVLKKDPIVVFKKYTDIYGTITNHMFANTPGNEWVRQVIKDFEALIAEYKKNPEELSKKTYELFLTTPFIYEKFPSQYINEKLRFGCFKLNYSDYYKKQKVVRLHFSPLREGLAHIDSQFRQSDLAPIYLNDRKNDFARMIKHIYDNPEDFKGATHFYSSTWLQNLPVYKSFFPRTRRKLEDTVFYWLWGQFIKWDYSGNPYRLSEFKQNLKKAKTFKQVVDAIPYKVYEVRIPLKRMFAYYGLNTKSETVTVEAGLEPLEFASNPLLQTHTACQLEE